MKSGAGGLSRHGYASDALGRWPAQALCARLCGGGSAPSESLDTRGRHDLPPLSGRGTGAPVTSHRGCASMTIDQVLSQAWSHGFADGRGGRAPEAQYTWGLGMPTDAAVRTEYQHGYEEGIQGCRLASTGQPRASPNSASPVRASSKAAKKSRGGTHRSAQGAGATGSSANGSCGGASPQPMADELPFDDPRRSFAIIVAYREYRAGRQRGGDGARWKLLRAVGTGDIRYAVAVGRELDGNLRDLERRLRSQYPDYKVRLEQLSRALTHEWKMRLPRKRPGEAPRSVRTISGGAFELGKRR
jgi:hypothetical protein